MDTVPPESVDKIVWRLNREISLKHSLPGLLAVLLLSGCSSLETIPYSPAQTPETWLSIQPYLQFQIGSRTIFLVQPTTTAIVYLLGMIAVGAGVYFLRIRSRHHSRFWWGMALLLWGIGAFYWPGRVMRHSATQVSAPGEMLAFGRAHGRFAIWSFRLPASTPC
jgi:hypothetical protein